MHKNVTMQITVLYLIWPEGFQDPHNKIGLQSPAIIEIQARSGSILSWSTIPQCYSPRWNMERKISFIIGNGNNQLTNERKLV